MHPSPPQPTLTEGGFTQLLSSTRRGARLARLLAATELHDWGLPPHVTERAAQITAELAANAVLHGHVRGRSFRLTLTLNPTVGPLRIEVTDARGDLPPVLRHETSDGTTGRGLLLVAALADRWGCEPYPPGGKTVWAEVSPGPHRPEPAISQSACLYYANQSPSAKAGPPMSAYRPSATPCR
ncbi:ATP-binding protein [Streptomyces sp. NPDC087917]|uniref:ATP-binding protein n=1 Tax=Streptomyces sp. NPDC087917 TaxID=3155060 RepID=UPI00343B46D2